jgi:hypothetical protein
MSEARAVVAKEVANINNHLVLRLLRDERQQVKHWCGFGLRLLRRKGAIMETAAVELA